MSGAEWAVTEPALPAPAWTLGKGGRPVEHCRRDIVDGIRYLVKEGIQWRAMPADFLLAHHLRLRQRVGENRRDRDHAR
jgi:transposase